VASLQPVVEPVPTAVAEEVAEPPADQVDVEVAEVLPPERPWTPPNHCSALDGMIGWFYAGEASPGTQGGTILMPNDVNVRLEAPQRSNGWSARTEVRCVLLEGDVIELSHEPVAISEDSYWVPLYGGDLISG